MLLFHYQVYYGIPDDLGRFGLGALSDFGWSGVDLFFVLSGYLIGDKLLGERDRSGRVRVGAFYVNRALRILPAYLAAVAIYFSIDAVQEGRGLQPLWRFLTFTQNLLIDLNANTFSHAWSLCVEEHFYLMLPLVLVGLSACGLWRHGWMLLVGLVVFGLVARYVSWTSFVELEFGRARVGAAFRYLYYPTYTRLDGLVVGLAVAGLMRYRPALRAWLTARPTLLAALGLGFLACAYVMFEGTVLSGSLMRLEVALLGFPIVSTGYGLLLIAALSPGCRILRRRFPPAAWIAALAYPLYLVHKMTNHVINTNFRGSGTAAEVEIFAMSLLAAFGAALVLHLCVEKPFLHLRDRLRIWGPGQPGIPRD